MKRRTFAPILAILLAGSLFASICAAQSSGRGGGTRMGSANSGTFDPRDGGSASGVKKVGRRGYEKVATLRLEQEGESMVLHVIPRSFTEKIAKIEVDGVRAEFDSESQKWSVTRAKPKKKPKLSLQIGDESADCKVQHFPHMGPLALEIQQKGDEYGPVICPGSDWADSL